MNPSDSFSKLFYRQLHAATSPCCVPVLPPQVFSRFTRRARLTGSSGSANRSQGELIRFSVRCITAVLLLVVLAAFANPSSQAQDLRLPPDGRTVDITKPPYNADNTGSSDVTAVINRAIRDGNANSANPRLIYFPKGTYRVSGTIEWRNGSGGYTCCVSLWGENKNQTTIRLTDGASGFGSANNPKAVLFMGSLPGGYQPANRVGGGNKGFFNFVHNLTVNVGSGNPGAVGIDLMSHNTGGLRNVNIIAPNRQGYAGLAMERPWPGPALIKNLLVEGFDYGIRMAERDYGLTFENVTLRNQNVLAIRNDRNLLWVRNLTSENRVPVLRNTVSGSQTVIIGGTFSGGSSGNAAIENDAGVLYARGLSVRGYGQAISNSTGTGQGAAGPDVAEFSSHDGRTLFGAPEKMLNLSIEETPAPYWSNDFAGDWAIVTDYGAQPNDGVDDGPGIQRAINSGKPFIYLPPGVYHIAKSSAPIRVRSSVRKIFSMYSYMQGQGWSGSRQTVFRVEGNSGTPVEIQGFWFPGRFGSNAVKVEQTSSRTVVVRDAQLAGTGVWNEQSGLGKLFLENVGGRFRFGSSQEVWARQLNPEGKGGTPGKVYNNGGDLWILGIKSERPGTLIYTDSGGKTELLGGMTYPLEPVPTNQPLFEVDNASMSAVMSTSANGDDHDLWVRQTKSGQTQTIRRSQLLNRPSGTHMPLYAGGFSSSDVPSGSPSPNAPPSVSITQPSDGATQTAPAGFSIEANATDSDGDVVEVRFFADGTALGTDTSAPFSYAWQDVPAGSYSLTARALDNDGAATTSSPIAVTVQTSSGGTDNSGADDGSTVDGDPVPPEWVNQDVGAVKTQGDAFYDDGTFTLQGAGKDIWGSSDAFHFTHQSLSGDGEIIAQVTTQTNTDPWAKAGVMIRASLEGDAPHAMMLVSPENGLAFQHRETPGEGMLGDNINIVTKDEITGGGSDALTSASSDETLPSWVRVVRRGDTMTGYASTDGSDWTEVASATVPMEEEVYVGLAVTSHEPGTLSTVTFENVARVGPSEDGEPSAEDPSEDSPRVSDALEVLYDFSSGSGSVVRDRSGSDTPLDLTIATPDAVSWGAGRLTVTGSARIASDGPATGLIDGITGTEAITIEAWVTPANTEQDGPARIVTVSGGPNARNFTLGQGRWGNQPSDVFDVRLRTTDTNESGRPSVTTPAGTVTTSLQHVIYTRTADGTAVLYVNGEETLTEQVDGALSNWNEGFQLALANELSGDRPWRGALHLVAAYSRALSASEVQTNFEAGPNGTASSADDPSDTSSEDSPRVSDALEVLYDFSSGSGSVVRDRSGSDTPLDLTIATPDAVSWGAGRLAVTGSARIASDGPATGLIDALTTSNAATVEAWVTPANTEQDGPARIVSVSKDPYTRNLTLGQGLWGNRPSDVFDVRLRTTDTDENGSPSVTTPAGTVTTSLQHVVYTRTADGTAVLYVNGEEVARDQVGGDLGSWDAGFRLALANELSGDRPWRGTLHLVAAYSRALSASEVQTNFEAGPNGDGSSTAKSMASSNAERLPDRTPEVEAFGLGQNYPNPFQSTTTISYQLPEGMEVTIEVFDVLGRRVAMLVDGWQPAGTHRAVLNGSRLPSGTYLYRIQTPTKTETRRMVLVR